MRYKHREREVWVVFVENIALALAATAAAASPPPETFVRVFVRSLDCDVCVFLQVCCVLEFVAAILIFFVFGSKARS